MILPPTCWPPTKAVRSWLTPWVIPASCPARHDALTAGSTPCDPAAGPTARRIQPGRNALPGRAPAARPPKAGRAAGRRGARLAGRAARTELDPGHDADGHQQQPWG